MYIPPWATVRGVPPEINNAWAKATAGMALTVLMAGASIEGERLQCQAERLDTMSPAQARAIYPDLNAAFTDLNRLQAVERCYWLNTPTADCADIQEVKLVAEDLHQRGALYKLGGLVTGVIAIGVLATSLRGLKMP